MSATRTELVASGAQTASGTSAKFQVPSAGDLFVGVDVTTGSSITTFDAWLQASDDGGTTWYDYPADLVLKSTTSGTGNTVTANARDIVDNKTTTTAEQFCGVYKRIAADYVRLRWALTGTSVTFSASMVAK